MKSVRIAIFFLLLLVVAFVSLAVRCLYLQYFKSEHYNSVSIKQQQKWTTQRPQRGVIIDCRGRLLAASNKIQTIFAEPRIIDNPEGVATQLAPILATEAGIIYETITGSRNPGFVRLKSDASEEQCSKVRKINNGIAVQSDWQRYYPMGNLTAHVVGFTDIDGKGLDGVELQLDSKLRGSQGQNVFFADKHRRTIRLKDNKSIVTDGMGVILTLDSAIQQFVRTELEKRYKEFEAESAVAIVAEPKTGAILAMVSLPDFDPNDRTCDPNNFRNRVITDQFEPGSMLKPIIATLAFDYGIVNEHERIFCENGSYSGKGFGRIGEYGDHQFGDLSLREILVKSSNIGMAKIGQRFKREKFYAGLRLFGFGSKTGIDLPGEVEGFLRPPDQWTGYSVTRIPFGQEITVTAIQMVRAFCVLANGGRSVTPYVVRAIVDSEGRTVKVTRPAPAVGFIVKPEVAKWIVENAMVGVVNERENGGTGWRARLEKWQVFGKTGTANIAKANEPGYSQDDYIASFVAGAPAQDPAIVVLVSIRKPNKRLGKGYTGGAVASPVAGKIIEKTLNYLERHRI